MPDRSLQGTQPSCGLRAGLQTGPGWGGLGASDSRPLLLVFHLLTLAIARVLGSKRPRKRSYQAGERLTLGPKP